MSIDAIRTRLVSDLGGITGVSKVFKDEPDVMPAPGDLPCFVLSFRDPACTARSETNSSVTYMWHFDLVFLYKPQGLGNPAENMSGLEDFIKLTIEKLYANFLGAGTYGDGGINKDTGTLEFSAGLVSRANAAVEQNKFWGFTGALDVPDTITTTMSTGV